MYEVKMEALVYIILVFIAFLAVLDNATSALKNLIHLRQIGLWNDPSAPLILKKTKITRLDVMRLKM